MSLPYNPRIVIEKTPNALLQKLFTNFPAFSNLDWKKLAENDVEQILRCLADSEGDDRRLIGARLRQAHTLAASPGTTVLIWAARDLGLNIQDDLAALKNALERAFWCLVEHPKLFDSERVYGYTYSLRKSSSETRVGFPAGNVVVTEAMVNSLKQSIKDTYKDEKRADECRVDHRENDGVHLFHAYPSDYVDEIDSYGPDGQLAGVTVKPPFHVVYYLDQMNGALTVLAKGGGDKAETLFLGFAKAIFGIPTPPRAASRTYDLSVFKNPAHQFKTDPVHQIRVVRVTAMRIHFAGQPRHRATFEVGADDADDGLYKLLSVKLSGGLGELVKSTILSVNLRVVFGVSGGHEEQIDFKISTPRWCTLGHDGKEGIVRRYLNPWGIEIDGKRMAARPKQAGVR